MRINYLGSVTAVVTWELGSSSSLQRQRNKEGGADEWHDE